MVTTKPAEKPAAQTVGLIDLKKGDSNWDGVVAWVSKNTDKSLKQVTDQLSRKYKLSASVKTELSKILTSK